MLLKNKIDYKVELEMLAVCMNIIFSLSFVSVFVATLYLEGYTLAKCPFFPQLQHCLMVATSLFSRGERSH